MDLPSTGCLPLDLFIGVCLLALVSWIGYEIHWHIKYRKEYSEVMKDKGVVTDMDYTPSRSTYNAATKTTTTSPEEHDVYIKFNTMGEQDFDDESLYQRVRVDDDVTAEYVEVWQVEKENPRKRKFMYYKILSITNPKGRVIEME